MDTRCCKYCGVEFSKITLDEGTFDEGYCCKFHRKDHEKQLIREGKMDGVNVGGVSLKNKQYTDASGETVWFPADEKPYFDQAFRRVFNSPAEKAAFMKQTGAVSSGESDLPKSKHRDLLEYTREQARKHLKDQERR